MAILRTSDELLPELFEFLRIPSDLVRRRRPRRPRARVPSGSASACARRGARRRRTTTAATRLAVGTIRCGRPEAPHVLVYGHYDVQTVAPLAAWHSPPFEPELRDGYIYARGASDDKGNFHTLLRAAGGPRARRRAGGDVTVASDGEEEIGGDSVVRWLDEAEGRFDAAIVFDGGFVGPQRPR